VIEILATGPLATVQDLGRPGLAALGVPRSGAFDREALRLANRLVGNRPDAAGVEVTLGGLALRTDAAVTVALAGAPCPGLDHGAAVTLPAGAALRLGTPTAGLRSYLAVRGGVATATVLGSRSTDTLSGLGPPALRPGDLLPVGTASGDVAGAVAPVDTRARPLRVDPGPRADWFAGDVLAALAGARWTVRGDSDRVGVRLDGPPLRRARGGELPSEPTLPGAVQVPADGRPIVFGPDGPVTGGYPVVGVVRDLAVLAQLRPGDPVRFVTGAR